MSNRVEDLERQVSELQAAVNGLTEELVEMKERVRQLEDAQTATADAAGTEAAPDASDSEPATAEADADTDAAAGGERRTHSDDHVEVVERTDDETASPDSAADAGPAGDEVVVPEQEATTPDAEGNAETDTDDEAESDSDIIVA
ncbi:hypothetical protein [Halorubrum sp. BV1]|uniref:DUF7518 family protein n=1 Tax=Halorubrum sp. BV1 TaxID=1498500 RepID=UPI000679A589|nr:hypothetical protein [Halorubrum sp. BV1]